MGLQIVENLTSRSHFFASNIPTAQAPRLHLPYRDNFGGWTGSIIMTPEVLGQQLRGARRTLGLTLEQLAQRTSMSLRLLSEAERGKPGVSIGRILRIASALGVDLRLRQGGPALLDLDRYPQLKLLAWQRADRRMSERDALALYEANWRFVDTEDLIPREAQLIRQLAEHHGNGVLNVP